VTAYEWVLILGMMVVTFGIRYFLLAFAGRIKLPPLMEASLNYIPPAVLMAMTVPAVLLPKGELHLSYTNPYLVAAILATAAGLLTKSLLATIAVGLFAFFVFQLLI
jgi:branched-subunit amino acid transport protein